MKIASLVFALLTLSMEGLSCMCFETPIDSSFANHPLVFEGRVASQYEDVFFYDRTEYSLITNLKITKDYKGTRNREMITIVGGFPCDFFFKQGETYIVFAYQRESGIYTTSICSNTQLKSKFDSSKMKTIEKWSKRYNDKFDLNYYLWSSEKVKLFNESEPERILRLAYHYEKQRSQFYTYAFIVAVIWAVVCSSILLFRKR